MVWTTSAKVEVFRSTGPGKSMLLGYDQLRRKHSVTYSLQIKVIVCVLDMDFRGMLIK